MKTKPTKRELAVKFILRTIEKCTDPAHIEPTRKCIEQFERIYDNTLTSFFKTLLTQKQKHIENSNHSNRGNIHSCISALSLRACINGRKSIR